MLSAPLPAMLANVNFGIVVLSPVGFVLMGMVVALEAVVWSRWFSGRTLAASGVWLALGANALSGFAGFVLSLAHNGGWWIVVWLPWVSSREVSVEQLPEFAVYLVVALVLSVLIELGVLGIALRSQPFRKVLAATVLANLLSSALLGGALVVLGRYAT